jgi:hypothetical protein
MAPKKKKPAHKLTTDELAKRAFPKKLHEHLKMIAHAEPSKKASS